MKRYLMKSVLSASLSLSLLACGEGAMEEAERVELIDDPRVSQSKDPLYVSTSRLWKTNSIAVCWESPSSTQATEREWVRSAATRTWAAVSRVDFTHWGSCPSFFSGIRIRVSDERPHVKAVGSDLNGMVGGMVLNFTFNNWGTSCRTDRQGCIEKIAVHEFGHALGFVHEQNRSDTPDWCAAEDDGSRGDVFYGVWDRDSVMNYCSTAWNNNGNLTDTDRWGVQWSYRLNGKPTALKTATGHYVVAEGSGGGVVNANRTSPGLWENFNVVDVGPGLVALQAINGQYVVAEGGGGREMTARANVIGPWETFGLIPMGPPSLFALKTHNGAFVQADGGGGGTLRSVFLPFYRGPGSWETFGFVPHFGG